eukprot:scaffold72413_cov61-Cyclotella_meneghiniana.AAC.1
MAGSLQIAASTTPIQPTPSRMPSLPAAVSGASIQPPAQRSKSQPRLKTSVRLTSRSGFSTADRMIEAG